MKNHVKLLDCRFLKKISIYALLVFFFTVFHENHAYPFPEQDMDAEITRKVLSSDNISISRLIRAAERNLQSVNRELEKLGNIETVKELVSSGDEHYADGNLEKAYEKWEKAKSISSDPSSIDNHIHQLKKLHDLDG